MVDPYAPPRDAPRTPSSPAPAPALAYEPYEPAQTVREREQRRPERRWREEREPHTEPARPGLFWVVAAVGIGLLLLGRLVYYFAVADDLPGELNAPALFATLGVITLSAGLALAGVLQRGLATPWRIALLLGAGFFAVVGWEPVGFGLL